MARKFRRFNCSKQYWANKNGTSKKFNDEKCKHTGIAENKKNKNKDKFWKKYKKYITEKIDFASTIGVG